MADMNEIEALRASLRGARNAAAALSELTKRVDAVDPRESDVPENDLELLQSLTLANAIAAQALRGFVESMQKRRGKLGVASVQAGNAGVEE